MIRDVRSVTTVLDEKLGGVGSGPMSLLRIVAWVVVGLLCIGWLWPAARPSLASNPYNKVLKSPDVRVVTLDKNDTRGFAPTHDTDAFTIAWIGASENQSISKAKYTFVPAEVQKIIPEIGGRPVVVDMYFLSGARIVDLYSAAQAAQASDADMIVLSLNPLWVFNDAAVQDWFNLNGETFVHDATDPSAWPLLAATQTPQSVTLGAAAGAFDSIRDRWTYSHDVRDLISHLSLLDTSAGVRDPGPPSELAKIKAMTLPLNFWNQYRPPVDPNADTAARQLGLLEQSDPNGGTFNDIVVRQLLGSLRSWDKPALLYVPPIAPEVLTDPATNEALARIESHLADVAAGYDSSRLTVLPESLARSLPPLEFNDIVHLKDVGPLAADLAARICDQLAADQITTACHPRSVTP